jgi:hypothetical protein
LKVENWCNAVSELVWFTPDILHMMKTSKLTGLWNYIAINLLALIIRIISLHPDINKLPPSKSTTISYPGQKRLKDVTTKETVVKKPKTKGSQGRKTAGGLSYSKDENQQDHQALAAIGGKDTTIFLFRALGKILYCKSEQIIVTTG